MQLLRGIFGIEKVSKKAIEKIVDILLKSSKNYSGNVVEIVVEKK